MAGDPARQAKVVSNVITRLAEEKAAFDIGAYRTAPPGFRFWAGATVEAADQALALDWLNWAYHEARKTVLG